MPSSANPFGDSFTLPSRPTVPPSTPYMPPADRITYGSSGSPGDASKMTGATSDGDPSWWDSHGGQVGGAAAALAPMVLSLFANNPYTDKTAKGADALSALAQSMGAQGKDIANTGMDSLAPVLAYLKAVTGADPGALNTAVQPEKARVLDQYDTARKALQFSPRGGGQAGATLQAGAREASDIATLLASARREGMKDLGGLGKDLLSTGVNEISSSSQALNAAITQYGSLNREEDSKLAGFGNAIGKALPFLFALL